MGRAPDARDLELWLVIGSTLVCVVGVLLPWKPAIGVLVGGDTGLPIATNLTGLAYPAGRVLLAAGVTGGVVATLCWGREARSRAVVLMTAAIAVLGLSFVADARLSTDYKDAFRWEWGSQPVPLFGDEPGVAFSAELYERNTKDAPSDAGRHLVKVGGLGLMVAGVLTALRRANTIRLPMRSADPRRP